MGSINTEKWRVRLAIVAIFLLGFVGGGLAVNLYNRKVVVSDTRTPPFMHRGPGLEGPLNSLNLNDEQKKQVEQILADTKQRIMEIRRASEPQMDDIKKQTRERLKTVLTEDQWNQFQQLIKEREAARQDRSDRPHHRPPFLQDTDPTPSPTQ